MKDSSSCEGKLGGANMARGANISNVGDDHHHHHDNHAPITPKQQGDPDPVTPTQAQAQAQALQSRANKEVEVVISYKECLKNHAASLGAHATDGCGEFIADGGDSLRCSACGCHRNFHRKEVHDRGALGWSPYLPQCHYLGGGTTAPTGVLRSRPGGPHDLTISMGPATSPCPCDNDTLMEDVGGAGTGSEVRKKRHRTKFTIEQKHKLIGFAQKAGWKIHKLDQGLVQQFCQEIGIKRRVLKVWMHNNKQNFVNNLNNDTNVGLSPPNDTISNSNSSNNN